MKTCPLTLSTADDAKHVAYQMARPAQQAVDIYNPSTIQDVADWVQAHLPVILTCGHFPYTLESKRTYLKYYYKHVGKLKKLSPPTIRGPFLVNDREFAFSPVLGFGMTVLGNFGKRLPLQGDKRLPLQGDMYYLDAVELVVRAMGDNLHNPTTDLTVYMEEHPKHQVLLMRERLYL